LTEINNGVRTEMHLCERCAVQHGIAVKSQMPINELLSNLLAVQPSDEEIFGPADKELSCPNCGITLDQFAKEGLLGCPGDYEVFEKSLIPLIERAHNGRTTHRGKVPSKAPENTKKQLKLAKLRQQLEEAIRKEDYERAAELRDQISKWQ